MSHFANRLTRVLLSALVAIFALGGQFAAALEEEIKRLISRCKLLMVKPTRFLSSLVTSL